MWPTEVCIEQHTRAGEEWHSQTSTGGTVESRAFGVRMPLEELYKLVL